MTEHMEALIIAAQERMPSLITSAEKTSICIDKQVGTSLYNAQPFGTDTNITHISDGFNKIIAPNAKTFCGICISSLCPAVHAEIDALLRTNGRPVNMCVSTLEPCWDCTKVLLSRGIRYFFFKDFTRNPGKNLWELMYDANDCTACWTKI